MGTSRHNVIGRHGLASHLSGRLSRQRWLRFPALR